MYKDLKPMDVKQILDNKNGARLIDVREEWEHKIASLPDSELMPISNFFKYIDKLNKEDELIIYCHTGVRSVSVCKFLADKGFTNLINLKGGINAWSLEVDDSVPRY